jgi:glycosyltransferase involved in cell wall biosynthesis
MRVLKIYDGDYPWDIREEKFLRTLTGAGHRVTLVARNKKGRVRRERLADPEGVEVRRLPCWGPIERLMGMPLFFNPVWVRAVDGALRAERPERLLVRDLALSPLVLAIGRRAGVPVVIDMAEPYPEALRANWLYGDFAGWDHLLRSPAIAAFVERRILRHAPRILVVSQESGERLERLGLPPGRWTLVGNTPDLERLHVPEYPEAVIPLPLRGRLIVIFSGIIVGDRGLEVALEGLKQVIAQRGPRVGMIVIGDGPARARFQQQARELELESDTSFLGWIPHEKLPAYWAAADVGILPFLPCTHMDTTLANKLFDYMAVGTPVLASDAKPMVRVLAETGAGITFRGGDSRDFAVALTRLLDQPEARARMGELGSKAVRERYCWAQDAERLLEAMISP